MIASSVIAYWKDSRRAVWASALLLGLLAAAVKFQYCIGVDRQAAQWMETIRTPRLDAAADAITFFGSSPWTIFAITVMGVWWVSKGRRARLLICVGTGLLGLILQMLLRVWVGQWRPESGLIPFSMDLVTRHDLAGFPAATPFVRPSSMGGGARCAGAAGPGGLLPRRSGVACSSSSWG